MIHKSKFSLICTGFVFSQWVADGSPTHSSTPVKIDGALQFVPKNTNPKEFKQLQQQVSNHKTSPWPEV